MEFNQAEDFALEVEKKPVYYHIYCYFDKKLNRFNQPNISTDEPEFVFESTLAGIKKGKFDAATCADLILVHLGDFDLKTGDFVIFEKGKVIVDCGQYLPKKEINTDA